MAGSNSKKQRKPKTSKGIHGAKHYPLDEVTKVLLSKGLYRTFIPVGRGQKKKED